MQIGCFAWSEPLLKETTRGISFIMIDMKTKGITVDPIITLDGAHEINTVYLEDVEVPKENIIFEENKGWTVAKFYLATKGLQSQQ